MRPLRGEGTEGWTPLTVHWAEEPERQRVVVGVCEVCDRIEPIDEVLLQLVSPSGLLHHAKSERTSCGKDATGPEWWWPL